jgi:hypothetical protein
VSLLSRLLGRDRPAPDAVTASVVAALDSTPGVRGTEGIAFEWRQYGSGALDGLVLVDSPSAYGEALRAAVRALRDLLGDDADRVVLYLGGRGPDEAAYDGATVGLRTSPTGWDVSRPKD